MYHSHQLQDPEIEYKFPHINHPLRDQDTIAPENFHGNHSKLVKKREAESAKSHIETVKLQNFQVYNS